MIVKRTRSEDEDLHKLIQMLDQELYEELGEDQKIYGQHNTLEFIKDVVLIYEENEAVACGALKSMDEQSAELKRMFVKKEYRNKGYAKKIVQELEDIAVTKSFKRMVLETGKDLIRAQKLYTSLGYKIMDNYGPYVGLVNSVCMEKTLPIIEMKTL